MFYNSRVWGGQGKYLVVLQRPDAFVFLLAVHPVPHGQQQGLTGVVDAAAVHVLLVWQVPVPGDNKIRDKYKVGPLETTYHPLMNVQFSLKITTAELGSVAVKVPISIGRFPYLQRN